MGDLTLVTPTHWLHARASRSLSKTVSAFTLGSFALVEENSALVNETVKLPVNSPLRTSLNRDGSSLPHNRNTVKNTAKPMLSTGGRRQSSPAADGWDDS